MANSEFTNEKRFPPPPREEDAALAVVDSQPYLDFDHWMDVELERLVARWIDSAAPNAQRLSLLRGRELSK